MFGRGIRIPGLTPDLIGQSGASGREATTPLASVRRPLVSPHMRDDARPLSGGTLNRGEVFRAGDTVRRPRREGSEVVEALLLHLEAVGFDAAPRFRGVDDQGRQVVAFVEGDVYSHAPWESDDRENAAQLGRIAAALQSLHQATASFVPPDASPQRPLPIAGTTWTHGDPGYPNVVYRGGQLAAFIDWEFAAPADPLCDPAALLGLYTRIPKPYVADNDRREQACRVSLHAIAEGYSMTDEQRCDLPDAAATVIEDAAAFWSTRPDAPDEATFERMRWRAAWLRDNAVALVG